MNDINVKRDFLHLDYTDCEKPWFFVHRLKRPPLSQDGQVTVQAVC